MAQSAKKFVNYFLRGKRPFADECKLIFYLIHLILTVAHKSQRGQPPPQGCPGVGGERTTSPFPCICQGQVKRTSTAGRIDPKSTLCVNILRKIKLKAKSNLTKGMVELAHLMLGGGACLNFWFKSSIFFGCRPN